MLEGFDSVAIHAPGSAVFARRGGSGPALLLLHGFPETHLMWRDVAPRLARRFTVVCADLPGYGASGCPPRSQDHAAYSKRAMARDMTVLMAQLGFPRFSLAGHDRGGRLAYRLALDHPECVQRLAVLDIVPTEDVWKRADARFALGYWPWSLLAQSAPLPERLISAAADALVDAALQGWGSPPGAFPPPVRAAYIDALRDKAPSICEEYRAAASVDWKHDAADREAARRIACPTLALWSESGPLASWYANDGGPLELWRAWCGDVRGHAMPGGHFFPEEHPAQTADVLERFFLG